MRETAARIWDMAFKSVRPILSYSHLRSKNKMVLPGGQVFDSTSEFRKEKTGYGLESLFVGAEGALGVITGASLKLFPKPTNRIAPF